MKLNVIRHIYFHKKSNMRLIGLHSPTSHTSHKYSWFHAYFPRKFSWKFRVSPLVSCVSSPGSISLRYPDHSLTGAWTPSLLTLPRHSVHLRTRTNPDLQRPSWQITVSPRGGGASLLYQICRRWPRGRRTEEWRCERRGKRGGEEVVDTSGGLGESVDDGGRAEWRGQTV